jgi:hypothetical protein
MKKILKTVYHNAVLFIQTLISILSVFFFSKFSFRRNFTALIKKNHNHCYLIANGPSLKQVFQNEKEIFEGQDVFTVNLFYETSFFYEMKPKNHIIADSGFWNPTDDPRLIEIHKNFKEKLLKVSWDMNFFVPYAGYAFIKDILKTNNKITIIPYNHTPVSGLKNISHFLYRNNLGMPIPTNVLNATIFIALNLGYKKLYLYGADHSWMKDLFIDEDNDICNYQNHFYDDEVIPYKMKKGSLGEGLKGIVDAFESYKLLEDYSQSIGSKIVNKTKGSYIDVFDRG